MYLSAILWFLTWPLLIIVSYVLIRMALKNFEKKKNN